MFIALPLFTYAVWYGVANTPFAFKSTEWLGVMSHMWLVYFYVSLALRENILRVVSAKPPASGCWKHTLINGLMPTA